MPHGSAALVELIVLFPIRSFCCGMMIIHIAHATHTTDTMLAYGRSGRHDIQLFLLLGWPKDKC